MQGVGEDRGAGKRKPGGVEPLAKAGQHGLFLGASKTGFGDPGGELGEFGVVHEIDGSEFGNLAFGSGGDRSWKVETIAPIILRSAPSRPLAPTAGNLASRFAAFMGG